jgi:hypothetical protein
MLPARPGADRCHEPTPTGRNRPHSSDRPRTARPAASRGNLRPRRAGRMHGFQTRELLILGPTHAGIDVAARGPTAVSSALANDVRGRAPAPGRGCRSRWTKNNAKPAHWPPGRPKTGDFCVLAVWAGRPFVPELAAHVRFRDFDFGMGNGPGLEAFTARFRRLSRASRKRADSGRSPLALFLVRLLRRGLDGPPRRDRRNGRDRTGIGINGLASPPSAPTPRASLPDRRPSGLLPAPPGSGTAPTAPLPRTPNSRP